MAMLNNQRVYIIGQTHHAHPHAPWYDSGGPLRIFQKHKWLVQQSFGAWNNTFFGGDLRVASVVMYLVDFLHSSIHIANMCIVFWCYSTLHFGLVRPPKCQWKFLSKNGWALHPLFVENSQVTIVWLCLTNSLTDQPVGRVSWHSSSSRQTLPCDAVQSLALALRTTGQGLSDLFWFLMLYVILCVYFASHWSQKSASWGIPSD